VQVPVTVLVSTLISCGVGSEAISAVTCQGWARDSGFTLSSTWEEGGSISGALSAFKSEAFVVVVIPATFSLWLIDEWEGSGEMVPVGLSSNLSWPYLVGLRDE